MITFTPFLKSPAVRERVDCEQRVEELRRVISVLFEGIGAHGYRYEAGLSQVFENAMRNLRLDFEHTEDGTALLLLAGGAVRLIAEHNSAAERYSAARRRELESVISMLSDTILEITRAAPEVALRVREVERDLSLSPGAEGIGIARERLMLVIEDLRLRAVSDESQTGGPDPVTGLPDATQAIRLIESVWNRRMDYYLAVIGVDRLDTINLRYGFSAGDQMLLLLSQHLSHQMLPGDRLFRWRGPCLALILERRVSEAVVSSELNRLAGSRIEAAIAFRDREVMVPISAAWNLYPLSQLASPDELARKVNDFAASRSNPIRMAAGRRFSAAAS